MPVVVGSGKKLFADGLAPHSYRLTGTRVSDTGRVVAHDEPAGDFKTAVAALDTSNDKESAHQKRMRRENAVLVTSGKPGGLSRQLG